MRALLLAAAVASCGRSDRSDPSRTLPAIVVDVLGRPFVGDETPTKGGELPRWRLIRTPTRSGLWFRVGDHVDVVLDRSGRIRIPSLRAGSVRIRLGEGVLRARVRPLPPGDAFGVEVRDATVDSAGGVLLVSAPRGTLASVAVLDGKATVNEGYGDVDVAAGRTWRTGRPEEPVAEEEARPLAALVAGRPWVARPRVE